MPHKGFKAGAALALAFFMCWPVLSARAGDVTTPDGPTLRSVLTDKTAFEADKAYRPWRQYFAADGTTIYFGDGPSSIGKWELRGNQYCSLWPPVKQWACYDVQVATNSDGATTIIWIAEDGSRIAGNLYDGDLTALRSPPKR